MSEQISIEKLKTGLESEFKNFVELYKNQVVNTCYGFTHNYYDAQDIAQDVFIEVYESINNFNENAQLSTWLYRISVNKSLDFIRKQKRKKRWADLTKIDINNKEEHDNWFSDSLTPELSLEQKERVSILNNAIGKLPTSQKTAFTLHKYDDLSYQEIAKVMESSVSSVESLMFRAKKNLKKSLEKYYSSIKDGSSASF